MPMHDWTRVGANVYHDFHGRWLYEIRDHLNAGVLPAGYYARAEQVTRTMGPDVLALQRLPAEPAAGPPTSGGAATRTRHKATAEPLPVRVRARRIGIHHSSRDRLVAIIELVSPGNKSSTAALDSFTRKVVRALSEGVHVLVVDPFPPGKRDRNGVHGVIWEELGGEPFAQPADQPLTLAAYEAAEPAPKCYVETLAAGQPLPDMPLFLKPDVSVDLPLEATYLAAWAKVLPQDRELLEPPAAT